MSTSYFAKKPCSHRRGRGAKLQACPDLSFRNFSMSSIDICMFLLFFYQSLFKRCAAQKKVWKEISFTMVQSIFNLAISALFLFVSVEAQVEYCDVASVNEIGTCSCDSQVPKNILGV